MKSFIIIIIITLGSVTQSQAQYITPLTKEISFYSSFSNTTVDNILDTITYSHDGKMINNKKYKINGPGNFNYTYLLDNENLGLSILNIGSNLNHETIQTNPTRNTDTLFIVLDSAYGLFTGVYIDREINTTGIATPTWINDTLGYLANMEHGIINILAILPFPNINIVFRDSIVHSGQDTVYLSADEARHELNYEPVDENGTYFGDLDGTYYTNFSILFDLANGGVVYIGWSVFGSTNCFVSDYHGVLDMHFSASVNNWNSGSSNYLVEFPEYDSIVNNITLTNNPDDLASTSLDYTFYAKRDFNRIGIADFTKCIAYSGNYAIQGIILYRNKPADENWGCTLHMDMQKSDKFGYCLQQRMKYILDGVDYPYIHSPIYDEHNDSIAGFWEFTPEQDAYFYKYDDTLFFGKGASFYWSVWSNFSGRISCVSDNMGIWGNYFYQNFSTDTYKIRDSTGNVIHEGSGLEIILNGLEPEQYTIELTNSFCPFNSYIGSSSLIATIDKSKYDPNPPPVSKIQLLSTNNNMKYHFDFGEDVILKFSASDFIGYDENHVGIGFQPVVDSLTNVLIKQHYSTNWLKVDCEKIISDSIIGYQYKSNLSDFLTEDSVMYDIKIYVEDFSGNSSEYTFSPAFIYGDFIVGLPEYQDSNNFYEKITFTPNPAHNEILINNIAEKDAPITYKIFNTNGFVAKKGELSRNTSSASINISDLTNGLYIIVLYENNNLLIMSKIIKM